MDRLIEERLLVFHEILRSGGVSAAARRLHVSQPAVSGRLRDLERRLGVDLFVRGQKRAEPTEAGRLLARTIERLVAVEREGLASLEAVRTLSAGQLSVAASETPAHHFLLPLLARFRKEHSGVSIKLDVTTSPFVLRRVLDGSHDIGFIEGDLTHSALVKTAFRRDPLRLVVSRRHPLAERRSVRLVDLRSFDFVLREPGSAVRDQVDTLLRASNVVPRIAAELSSTEAVKGAVAIGLGISFVPAISVRGNNPGLASPAVRSAALARTIWCVRRARDVPSAAAAAFLPLLVAE